MSRAARAGARVNAVEADPVIEVARAVARENGLGLWLDLELADGVREMHTFRSTPLPLERRDWSAAGGRPGGGAALRQVSTSVVPAREKSNPSWASRSATGFAPAGGTRTDGLARMVTAGPAYRLAYRGLEAAPGRLAALVEDLRARAAGAHRPVAAQGAASAP